MVKKLLLPASLVLVLAALAAPARADEPAPPSVHHAPIASAREGHPIVVGVTIEHPERAKRAVLVYSSGGALTEVAFERAAGASPYAATIPAPSSSVRAVGYAIEIEDVSGRRAPAFASREDLHPVAVVRDDADRAEAALLDRVGGRRSVFAATGEYVSFGGSDATVDRGGRRVTESFRDTYWRTDVAYTYRLFRTVSEFGIRFGVVRGQAVVPGERDPGKFDVGLNYGSPRVRFRVADWVHVDAELLTSVTEVGFSVGGGGAVMFGDPYGARVTFGLEGVKVFGVRGYSRLDLVAGKRFTLAPIVEVTNMPHTDAGVRLLADVGIDLGAGFAVGLRGGWQARRFDLGGPTAGGHLQYAF
ncbi:MAG: hypothetical protein JNL38_00160 [Myxococcales bacterium]|jgi:hypothetical protein|nr:hypothetical protein [Myxococcales bacterium]